MNSNKNKIMIAKLLSAGMVISMLAPAMPVYAAPVNIEFDMGKTYRSLGGQNPTTLTGNPGANMSTATGATLVADTSNNNQTGTSGGAGFYEMPFWDTVWLDTAGNNINGVSPTGYNFPGYLLKGWYVADPETNPAQTRVNHLPTTIPYTTTTYYAAFVPDTTKSFNHNQEHVNATGVHALISGSNTTASENVMKTVSSRPLNIYGYKGMLKSVRFSKNAANPVSGDMASDLDGSGNRYLYPSDLVDGTENVMNQYRFVYSSGDQTFTGNMINRDLTTVMEYSVDTTKKFRLTVEHEIQDAGGAVTSTDEDFSHSFNVEQTITGVGPKSDLITPQGGNTESRYKLVSATFINTVTAGPYKHTMLTVNQAQNGGVLSNSETNADALINRTVDSNGFLISGNLDAGARMPNQGVLLKYTYKPNPNYTLNVKTKYVSQDGTDLTPIVATRASLTAGGDGMIETTGAANSTVTVPYPSLNDIGYGTPTYLISGGTPGASGIAVNLPAGTATAAIGTDSYVLTVTYPRLPSFWAQLMFQTEGNGSLEDPAYPVGTGHAYTNANANAIRLVVNGDGSVDIPTTLQLPHAVAGDGYDFAGYYDMDAGVQVTDATGAFISSTPYHLTDPGSGLVAKFVHNSSWLDFTFKFAGSNGEIIPSGPVTGSIYPLDNAGNPRVIGWADLDPDDPSIAAEFVGVRPSESADTGYTIKWYDQNGTELVGTTNMAGYPTGSVFTARAVSTAPLALNQPVVTASINPGLGVAQLTVASFNSDPTVKYIVTTADGRVVTSVSNMNLQALGGVISGAGIIPDTVYHVYEAAPDVSAPVGSNISGVTSSMLSSPLSSDTVVTTPIAVDPQISADPANPNLNQMALSPVTPGQQYAILDEGGNIVLNWTTPISNTLTVGGLTPGRTYSLVTRPVSDTTSTPGSHNKLNFIASNLRNIITLVNPSDINIVSPAGLDLNNVPTEEQVELRANPVSGSNIFTGNWEFILGQPIDLTSDGSTTVRFKMPIGRIVLRAVYQNDIGTWAPLSGFDNIRDDRVVGPNGSVNAIAPILNTPGNFRLVIERTRVSNSDNQAVKDAMAEDNYRGLWSLVVKVQQEVSGSWQDYVDPNLTVDTYVNLGALEGGTRTYTMHHMATGSNAERLSDVEGMINPAANFDGLLRYSFLNGGQYIFGYTGMFNTVTFVDVRNASTVATVQVAPGGNLKSASGSYSGVIPASGTTVGDRNTGLTWTYVGLRKSANGTGNVDEDAIVNQDMTVYLYYTSDQDYRNQLVNGLNDSIAKTDAIDPTRYNAADVAAVQAKAAQAKALLARTAPNMALSPELAKVLEELNALLNKMGIDTKPVPRPDNGGTSNRGGGSGGGGNNSAKKNTQNSGIKVGQDGNWELLNPEEKNLDKSKWVFNLKAGGRVKGWAYLSYTYEGKTKSEWYHFGEDNIMNAGWFFDGNTWYYLSTDHNGFYGEMIKGWYHDSQDGKWYYLDANNGGMHTGWNKIDGDYYYFNPTASVQTWFFDNNTGRWNFSDVNSRPLGSMYQNENTPDGYHINENGVWR